MPFHHHPKTLTCCCYRFVLKYASRDEIEILDSGSGGITEIRSAISRYEEPSPLYGFLRYRRRSVIIKYIPEDCSRLIQGMIIRPLTKRGRDNYP